LGSSIAPSTHWTVERVDAVIVLQQAADPDRRRHGVELDADPLALKILRLLDHAGIDRDEAVPEHARWEHRQGDERTLAGRVAADVFRRRHLRGVELEPAHHAIEQIARMVDRDEVEVDTVGFHLAGIERHHAVVEAAGEGHGELGHCSSWFAVRSP
jgi:hypothetical protein